MRSSECQATQATALELEAALDIYERHVRRLARTWLDMDLYREVSAEIDAIRCACANLPELSVPWVALLVSHAELVHCLWLGDQPDRQVTAPEMQQRLDEHVRCIRSLAERGRRLAEGH